MNILYKLCTLILLFTMNLIQLTQSLHLTNYQIKTIKNLLQNPRLTSYQKDKINIVLYKAYEKWSVSKAIEFKSQHKNKCYSIKTCLLYTSPSPRD